MQYSWEEIMKHRSDNDCWLVAHNKVYNVTEFLKLHPPEGDVISRFINRTKSQDCTKSYDFHSKEARKLWKKYLIGIISKTHRCIIL